MFTALPSLTLTVAGAFGSATPGSVSAVGVDSEIVGGDEMVRCLSARIAHRRGSGAAASTRRSVEACGGSESTGATPRVRDGGAVDGPPYFALHVVT